MDEIILAAAGAVGGGVVLLGQGLAGLRSKPKTTLLPTAEHVHERDCLIADGKGWRCQHCWDAGTFTAMPRST